MSDQIERLGVENDKLRAELAAETNLKAEYFGKLTAANLQIDGLKKEVEAYELELGATQRALTERLEKFNNANRLISAFPKKLLESVLAEQDRCAKIAEVFWNDAEKLNADLRADKTQAEKNMAYMISTHIRALRRRESDFAEKRQGGA